MDTYVKSKRVFLNFEPFWPRMVSKFELSANQVMSFFGELQSEGFKKHDADFITVLENAKSLPKLKT